MALRPRPRIRAYFAISLDGMIADEDGGISWLTPFEQVDVGFESFLAEISTIAVGRRTYEQLLTFGEWPYAGKDVIVVTTHPLHGAPPGVRAFSGTARALARQISGGDMWVMGGASVFNMMLWSGHIQRIQLFVTPVVLGRGVRLFSDDIDHGDLLAGVNLRCRGAHAHPLGMVELTYDVLERGQ